MELLSALGLNSTIVPQFFIFMVAYIALTQLVFKPYLQAFNARKQATYGNQESAEQTILEAQDIQYKYESKAKEINNQIKSIYDSARKQATTLQEELVHGARAEAEQLTKKNREEISIAVGKVREDLKKHVPELSQAISNRLLGKEVH